MTPVGLLLNDSQFVSLGIVEHYGYLTRFGRVVGEREVGIVSVRVSSEGDYCWVKTGAGGNGGGVKSMG